MTKLIEIHPYRSEKMMINPAQIVFTVEEAKNNLVLHFANGVTISTKESSQDFMLRLKAADTEHSLLVEKISRVYDDVFRHTVKYSEDPKASEVAQALWEKFYDRFKEYMED